MGVNCGLSTLARIGGPFDRIWTADIFLRLLALIYSHYIGRLPICPSLFPSATNGPPLSLSAAPPVPGERCRHACLSPRAGISSSLALGLAVATILVLGVGEAVSTKACPAPPSTTTVQLTPTPYLSRYPLLLRTRPRLRRPILGLPSGSAAAPTSRRATLGGVRRR